MNVRPRDNCWITPPSTISSSTVSCPDSADDNSVGMWHHALSLQPRTTVQRAAYFAQFKVDIDKYSSVPGLSADMTRSRLSCWAGRVSGSADCMIHPDLGPEVCLQWAYSVPYSAVRCSTVQYSGPASTAALGWAGLAGLVTRPTLRLRPGTERDATSGRGQHSNILTF